MYTQHIFIKTDLILNNAFIGYSSQLLKFLLL